MPFGQEGNEQSILENTMFTTKLQYKIPRKTAPAPRFAVLVEWDTRPIHQALSDAAIAAIDAYLPGWREGAR